MKAATGSKDKVAATKDPRLEALTEPNLKKPAARRQPSMPAEPSARRPSASKPGARLGQLVREVDDVSESGDDVAVEDAMHEAAELAVHRDRDQVVIRCEGVEF
jgi:hypothetical protein